MRNGKVKFYNHPKGYGFIQDDETGKDIFVHISGVKDDIKQGDDVTFETIDGKRGLNAVNVQLTGK